MKTSLASIAIAALALFLASCQSPPESPQGDLAAADEVMVQTLFDQSARNAVAAERIVYPYHFHPNDKQLTDLGEQQIQSLVPVYMAGPGRLSVPRGEAPAELYQARVQTIRTELSDAGVDLKNLTIVEDLPGGPGIASEQAVKALEKPIKSEPYRSQMAPSGASK